MTFCYVDFSIFSQPFFFRGTYHPRTAMYRTIHTKTFRLPTMPHFPNYLHCLLFDAYCLAPVIRGTFFGVKYGPVTWFTATWSPQNKKNSPSPSNCPQIHSTPSSSQFIPHFDSFPFSLQVVLHRNRTRKPRPASKQVAHPFPVWDALFFAQSGLFFFFAKFTLELDPPHQATYSAWFEGGGKFWNLKYSRFRWITGPFAGKIVVQGSSSLSEKVNGLCVSWLGKKPKSTNFLAKLVLLNPENAPCRTFLRKRFAIGIVTSGLGSRPWLGCRTRMSRELPYRLSRARAVCSTHTINKKTSFIWPNVKKIFPNEQERKYS